MSDVAMGKLLPNLKVTLGNDSDKELMEDGELSSDTEDSLESPVTKDNPEKDVKIVRSWMNTLQPNPKVYENKNGGFVTGLDLSSEVLSKKLDERAERFGIEKKEVKQVTQKEIDALYESWGIDLEESTPGKPRHFRLNAIHVRGVEEMSTNEIFKYFGDYGPSSVEWINDCSCNVVWLDEATTARALLGMSEPMTSAKKNDQELSGAKDSDVKKKTEESELSGSEESENDKEASLDLTVSDMEVDEVISLPKEKKVDVPVPPGTWRVGAQHPKAKALLFRFATRDDKKIRGAEKRSHYYQKYGNPNYGGMRGIISTSKKRKLQAAKNKDMVESISEKDGGEEEHSIGLFERPPRDKKPRMKMYADEEEEKGSKVSSRVEPVVSIHSRLGKKYTRDDLHTLGRRFSDQSSSSEEEEPQPEVHCTVPDRYKIWTDIAREMSEECAKPRSTKRPPPRPGQQDLRSVLNKAMDHRQDLRAKLNKRTETRGASPSRGTRPSEAWD